MSTSAAQICTAFASLIDQLLIITLSVVGALFGTTIDRPPFSFADVCVIFEPFT